VRSTCQSCRNLVRSTMKGTTLEDIAKTLDRDEEKQKQWVSAVTSWEDAFENTPVGGRIRNAASKFRVPQVLKFVEANSRQGEVLLGIFWPKAVYERVKKLTLDDADCETYVHGGKKLRGKFLDYSEGSSSGCIKVSDTASSSISRESTIANSAECFGKHEVADLFHKAQKQLEKKVSSSENTQTGLQEVTVKHTHKKVLKPHDSDSSASGDWISRFASPSVLKRKAADEDESDGPQEGPTSSKPTKKEPPLKKARGSKQQATAATLTPKKSTPSSSAAPELKMVYPSQQQREVNTITAILNTINERLNSLTNAEGLKALTPGIVQQLQSRLAKKQTDDIHYKLTYRRDTSALPTADMEVDAQAADGHDLNQQCDQAAAGMAKATKQLEAAMDLALGLTNAPSSDFRGGVAFFHQALDRCRLEGIVLSVAAEEKLVRKQVDSVFSVSEPEKAMRCLVDKEAEDLFGIWRLSQNRDHQAATQASILFALVDQVAQDDSDPDAMGSFFERFKSVDWILSASTRDTFFAMWVVATTESVATNLEASRLQKAYAALSSNTGQTARFAMSSLGKVWLARSKEALRLAVQDRGCLLDLQQLSEALTDVSKHHTIKSVQGCRMTSIRSQAKLLAPLAGSLKHLQTNASKGFLLKHTVAVKQCVTSLDTMYQSMADAQEQQFWEHLGKVLAIFANNTGMLMAKKDWEELHVGLTSGSLVGAVAMTEATGLSTFLGKEQCEAHDHRVTGWADLLSSLQIIVDKSEGATIELDIMQQSSQSLLDGMLALSSPSSEKAEVAASLCKLQQVLRKQVVDRVASMAEEHMAQIVGIVSASFGEEEMATKSLQWPAPDSADKVMPLPEEVVANMIFVANLYHKCVAGGLASATDEEVPGLSEVGGVASMKLLLALHQVGACRRLEHAIVADTAYPHTRALQLAVQQVSLEVAELPKEIAVHFNTIVNAEVTNVSKIAEAILSFCWTAEKTHYDEANTALVEFKPAFDALLQADELDTKALLKLAKSQEAKTMGQQWALVREARSSLEAARLFLLQCAPTGDKLEQYHSDLVKAREEDTPTSLAISCASCMTVQALFKPSKDPKQGVSVARSFVAEHGCVLPPVLAKALEEKAAEVGV
jgi:hypothetical protein